MDSLNVWDLVRSTALIAGGFFAGTLFYTTAIGHRVRLEMGPPVALRHFLATLPRSERVQPLLHVICLVATIALTLHSASPLLIAALVAMAPILPLSFARLVPLNAKLKEPTLSPDSPEATAMLEQWGRLHRVRAICGSAGFVLLALA